MHRYIIVSIDNLCFISHCFLCTVLVHCVFMYCLCTPTGNYRFIYILDFLAWKEDEEERTLCRYVTRQVVSRQSGGAKVRTYVCHRSGLYKPRGRRLRHLKVQGSKKIGSVCPASITVTMHASGNLIHNAAIYCCRTSVIHMSFIF